MANEGVIKVDYPVTGLGTLTAAILKPDDTTRDSQTAVALVDTGHLGRYSNAGAITIEAGDTVKISIGGAYLSSAEYIPDVTVANPDDCKADVSAIAADVAGLNGDAMRGTNGANTVVPDVAGTAATLIAALNNVTAGEVVTALLASTGVTVGGTWTFATLLKVLAAWAAGNARSKSATVDEILDPDNETTVIAEVTLSKTTPFKTVEILI